MTGLTPLAEAHFRQPRNAGLPETAGSGVGTGRAGAVGSGIEVVFRVVCGTDGAPRLVGWECQGCPATIACCSWASERLLRHGAAVMPTALDMQQALELPAEALSRALLVEDAIREAVAEAAMHCDNETR
ncbi:MAG: iron-sulfur cluster assembly scaffold protein [Ectothiorhodospiraceae bacterium]|nr:iron-sulfur cluster assembly scaffold protein [Ectothiorhodospiraceae bacterium]